MKLNIAGLTVREVNSQGKTREVCADTLEIVFPLRDQSQLEIAILEAYRERFGPGAEYELRGVMQDIEDVHLLRNLITRK